MSNSYEYPEHYVVPENPFSIYYREYEEIGRQVAPPGASIPLHAVFPTPKSGVMDPVEGEDRFYSKEFVESVGGKQWGPAEGPPEWLEIPQRKLWQSRTQFAGDNPWQTYPDQHQQLLNDAFSSGQTSCLLEFKSSGGDRLQSAAGTTFEVDFGRMIQENVQDRGRTREVRCITTVKRHWYSVRQVSTEPKPYGFERSANTMLEEGTSEGRCRINNAICHQVTTYGHVVYCDTVNFRQYESSDGGKSRRLFHVPEPVAALLPREGVEGEIPRSSALFRRLSAHFDATKFGMRARTGEVTLHEHVKVQNARFVLNKEMYLAFMEKCFQFGDSARVCMVYHGTNPGNIETIMHNNFSIDKLGKATGDQGWFGAGIYFGRRAYTALGYNRGEQLLCSLVVLSKVFRTPMPDSAANPYHGKPCKEGYDAHVSPTGKELVVFNQRQILPCFLLELNTDDYKHAGYNDYYGYDLNA